MSKLNDAFWAILHRIHPRHRYHVVQTGLRPGYHENGTRIMHATMTVFVEYVEVELEGVRGIDKFLAELRDEREDFEGVAARQIEHLEACRERYLWWTATRPELTKALWVRILATGDADGDTEPLFAELDEVEAEEQRVLEWVVRNRQDMWS
jgi:hypothetical protein